MSEFDNLDHLEPCLYEIDESMREVHDYKIKKRQFLESTGIVKINEPNGLVITKAVVSGLNVTKDVTDIILLVNIQHDCPLETLTIDTGKLNEYTGVDIEVGSRKLIEVHYITDDVTFEEKRVNKKQIIQENKVRVYDREDECKDLPKFESDGVSQIYQINKERVNGVKEQ
jgi:hypothetical protein